MRKLFNEFFYIPKHGKIREKVMLTRIAMTITIMVMCLAAMSITAYAYFSYNITSGSNTIKAANFATNVGVKIESAGGEDVEVRTSNHISHEATLTGGKTYFITLQHTNRSTAQTGFVIITAKDCDSRYHTQQIGRNEDGTSKTITFKLQPTADTVVTFCSHWGTSSNYPDFKDIKDDSDLYIQGGETIVMIVNGVVDPPVKSEAENDTPPAESNTIPSESTTPSEPATPPETTETTEPTITTEPGNTDEPVATEPTDTTAGTETQPAEETAGAPTTEANN